MELVKARDVKVGSLFLTKGEVGRRRVVEGVVEQLGKIRLDYDTDQCDYYFFDEEVLVIEQPSAVREGGANPKDYLFRLPKDRMSEEDPFGIPNRSSESPFGI